MILFTMRCAHGHEFEGWFRDGDGFEAQQKSGEIACPECGNTAVEKAVMAPRLARSRETPAITPAQFRAALVGSITGRSIRTAFMARPVKRNRGN